jgi:hypothetical protein
MGILSRLKREERAREAALRVPGRTSHLCVPVTPPLVPAPEVPVQKSPVPDLTRVIKESVKPFSLEDYNKELDKRAMMACRFTGYYPRLAKEPKPKKKRGEKKT